MEIKQQQEHGLRGVLQVYENPWPEFREWAAGRSPEAAWAECPRGDWLLWWAAWTARDRRPLVLAAAACLRLALPLVEGEDGGRALRAIEAAEAWARAAPSGEFAAPWHGPEGLEANLQGGRALWWAEQGRGSAAATMITRKAGALYGYASEHGAIRACDAADIAAFYSEDRPGVHRRCADLVRAVIPFPGSVPTQRSARQRALVGW